MTRKCVCGQPRARYRSWCLPCADEMQWLHDHLKLERNKGALIGRGTRLRPASEADRITALREAA